MAKKKRSASALLVIVVFLASLGISLTAVLLSRTNELVATNSSIQSESGSSVQEASTSSVHNSSYPPYEQESMEASDVEGEPLETSPDTDLQTVTKPQISNEAANQQQTGPSQASVLKPEEQQPKPPSNPQYDVYIVLDDAGYKAALLAPFFEFPGSLTFAVLPGLSDSVESARLIRAAGHEVMLHQPLPAKNGKDPGPGLLTADMPVDRFKAQLESNLMQLEPIFGINNHMGSLGTEDARILDPLMAILKQRGLFFLDSRTSAESKAGEFADRYGLKFAQRDVFLDNEPSYQAILRQFEIGIELARKRGAVIMIGHVWNPELARVLVEQYTQRSKEGFQFKKMSERFLP